MIISYICKDLRTFRMAILCLCDLYLDADATPRKYICKTTFVRSHELGSRTKCIGHHSCSGTSCRLNLAPEPIRTATQPTDALRPAPVPIGNGGSSAGVVQSPPAFHDAFTSMLTVSVRKYSSGFCVPAQLRDAEIIKRWADNRGGQGVLHGAGVQDAHNVAGEGRRKRGEERPVQPVLTVQLDDLRTHPRKSRDVNKKVQV